MKNKKIILTICIVILVVIIATVGIITIADNKNTQTEETEVNEKIDNIEENSPREPTLDEIVDEEISKMSLREKIGQMLVISYSGVEYTNELDELLKSVKPGGFILFGDNISNYNSTVEYISKIQNSADIPMIISVDQEGGKVQRIKNVEGVSVLEIPNMYTLGKTDDSRLSYDVGKVIAEELLAFGVNTDFAPTIDIFSNPNNTVIGNRAFGSDSETVINMALPLARGMKDAGVIPTYKHFPGHGDTDTDSHVELPVVSKTKEELYRNELLPFKAAIENGAEMIMVAHIALPNVTGNYIPASLSNEIVNGLLRDELNFNGVVITDAVNMKAISDNYSVSEICNYAINAGVDIILMPVDPIETLNTIEQLVNDNVITEERINESAKRILLMKHNNKMYEEREINSDNIGTQEHIDIINKVYLGN